MYLFTLTNYHHLNSTFSKVSAALRIMCNTVPEPSGQVACVLLSGGIENVQALLDKLLHHEYIHIRQETLWLLGKIKQII